MPSQTPAPPPPADDLTALSYPWPLADESLVGRAFLTALSYHWMQRRRHSGEPYLAHLTRVAHLVFCQLRSATAEELAIALLHDVVEDTTLPLEELRLRFPVAVCQGVDQLTKRKDQSLAEYLKGMSPRIQAIKMLDRLDNLTCGPLPSDPPGWATRYLRTSEELLAICRPAYPAIGHLLASAIARARAALPPELEGPS